MDVLTCVYPQVDLEVMGGAERLATVGAILGGRALAALTVLGQSRLNAPRRFARVLPNIWSTHKEGETNGRCVECHFKPAPRTSRQHAFLFFPFPFCLSLIVPRPPPPPLPKTPPAQNMRTAHKVKRIKWAHWLFRMPPAPRQNADSS